MFEFDKRNIKFHRKSFLVSLSFNPLRFRLALMHLIPSKCLMRVGSSNYVENNHILIPFTHHLTRCILRLLIEPEAKRIKVITRTTEGRKNNCLYNREQKKGKNTFRLDNE